MMINKVLLLFLFLLFSCEISPTERKERMVDQASEMSEALINKEYNVVVSYTYPLLVNGLGGPAKMIQTLRESMKGLKEKGTELLEVKIGKPSKIYNAGTELHSLLSETLIMKVTGGTLISKSFLLAISEDGGESWYFIDTVKIDKRNIRSIFPNFNDSLEFPSIKKPVFIPDSSEKQKT